jgi:hypothetical protein
MKGGDFSNILGVPDFDLWRGWQSGVFPLSEIDQPKIRDPQEEVHLWILARGRKSSPEKLDGVRKLEFSLVQNAQSLQHLGIVGCDFQRLPVGALSSPIVLCFLPGCAPVPGTVSRPAVT